MEERTEDLHRIIRHYGFKSQFKKAREELRELRNAIKKNDIENIIEEIADVQIMIDQLKLILDCHDKVKKIDEEKRIRTLTGLWP